LREAQWRPAGEALVFGRGGGRVLAAQAGADALSDVQTDFEFLLQQGKFLFQLPAVPESRASFPLKTIGAGLGLGSASTTSSGHLAGLVYGCQPFALLRGCDGNLTRPALSTFRRSLTVQRVEEGVGGFCGA